MALTKKETKLTRIEERISATEYNVIHPETVAQQVIESDDKQFVSKAEKDLWNTLASIGLKYQGDYAPNTNYNKNDVVQHNGKFYICKNVSINIEPEDLRDSDNWINFNKEAVQALQSEGVLTEKIDGTFALALTPFLSDTDYHSLVLDPDNTVKYDTVNNKLIAPMFKGDLEGTADDAKHADRAAEAEKYVKYKRNEDGTLVSGIYTEDGTEYIDTVISGINKRLDGITSGGGGAILANKLTINKDGVFENEFNGSQAVTLDIKQTYTPEEISDLTENSKIKEKWLPDSILGQLKYKGTWRPQLAENFEASTGDYYIAIGNGPYYPDGTKMSDDAEWFLTGDWAVYNGTTWDKIDNTDAVRTVNGQIGDVKTFKGNWVANTQYYLGDIVKYNGVLYVANVDNKDTTFDAAKWEIFGRIYSADDGIKLENDTFKHDVIIEENTNSSVTLDANNKAFGVHEITKDAFGHVTKINVKTVTLGEDFIDTVRPVKVDGTEILGAKNKTALNLISGTKINITNSEGDVTFNHAESTATVKDFTVVEADKDLHVGEQFSIPSFNIDNQGHIISGNKVTFKIADDFIKHEHFEITKDESGSQIIAAYKSINTATKLNEIGGGKFYQGLAKPTATDTLKLNAKFYATQLFQGTNQVLDSAMKIVSGYKFTDANLDWEDDGNLSDSRYIISADFDLDKKRIILGDSGIIKDSSQQFGIYSAVAVNRQGIAVAGGQILEFGSELNADPSDALAVGGLFFRKIG